MITAINHCSSVVTFCYICLANTWVCLCRTEILKCSLIKNSGCFLNVRCFLLLVHNLIWGHWWLMCILKSKLLQAYSVIVSAHLIFMKRNFLFTTDESMKTAPAPQFSSPFTQIQKEKANKRNSTILKHTKKLKITLVAPEGLALRFRLQRMVVLLVWASGFCLEWKGPHFFLGKGRLWQMVK